MSYWQNGQGTVQNQDNPSFPYPNDIIGRTCFVRATMRMQNWFTWLEDGYARDIATGISAESKGWKSQNGARKHALEQLNIKLHAHFEEIRRREREEAERRRREAEIQRLQQQLITQRNTQRQTLNDRLNWLGTQLIAKQNEYRAKNLELTNIEQQIDREEKEIEEFKIDRHDPDIKILVILGHTGDGKSTFCNRLYGDTSLFGDNGPFETSGNGQSCTQNHSKRKIIINNNKIIIVDTPGFNDSFGRDREHSNKLCKYLKGCGGINNILLIRNSTNVRFDEGFQKMLEQYHAMFGDVFFKLLIIIATRVDSKINILQFETNNQTESMQQDISDKFELDFKIPVICIGLEHYADSITNLMNKISDEKEECVSIKSPIDELKVQYNEVKEQNDALRSEFDRVRNEIASVRQSINSL